MAYSAHRRKTTPVSRKQLVLVAASLVALYVVLPQLHDFHSALTAIGKADMTWIGVALGATLASYLAAAGVYVLLAKQPLRYGQVLLVQIASMFANRLLPAGVGAIGVNYAFLRRRRHSNAQAAAVVAANNTLGFVANMILLAVLLLAGDVGASVMHWPHVPHTAYVAAALVATAITAVVLGKYRQRVRRLMLRFVTSLANYRLHPLRLLAALMCSALVTLSYTLCLYASMAAVGVHVGFGPALVIMTLGVAGATVTPTPGGLGGAEAGLVAGLLLYDVGGSVALAAALLYRLITYWLALAIGATAFVFAERRKYI